MFKHTFILTLILSSAVLAQENKPEEKKGKYEEAVRARLQAEHQRLAAEQAIRDHHDMQVRFAQPPQAIKMVKLKVAYCGVGTSEANAFVRADHFTAKAASMEPMVIGCSPGRLLANTSRAKASPSGVLASSL